YVGPFIALETHNIWMGSTIVYDVWNAPPDPIYDRLFVAQFRNFGSTFPPSLNISSSAGNVTITFNGLLQSAPSVNGPWTTMTGTTSPYTTSGTAAAKFFRA